MPSLFVEFWVVAILPAATLFIWYVLEPEIFNFVDVVCNIRYVCPLWGDDGSVSVMVEVFFTTRTLSIFDRFCDVLITLVTGLNPATVPFSRYSA